MFGVIPEFVEMSKPPTGAHATCLTKQENRPRVWSVPVFGQRHRVWSDYHLQHFVYLGPVGFQCFVPHQGADMPAFGEDLDDVMGGGLDQVF